MSDSRSVGARNDDSSLFSLDSLKKTEEAAKKPKGGGDDSGLIDLKALALMAKEQKAKEQDALASGTAAPSAVSVASVIAPPDLFAISAPVASMSAPLIPVGAAPVDQTPKAPKTKLFVAAGLGVAVVGAALAFAFMRGPGDAAAAPGAAKPTAAPVVTAAPAPPPEEPKVAAVTPGERPAPPEDPKPAPTASAKAAPAPAARVPGPLPVRAAPKPEAPAAPPPPPKDACDLGCQMQRAVNAKKK